MHKFNKAQNNIKRDNDNNDNNNNNNKQNKCKFTLISASV